MARTTTKTTTSTTTRGRKNKYNVNNNPFQGQLSITQNVGSTNTGSFQYAVEVVPSDSTQGVRKAGKFTVSLSLPGKENDGILYWALVYVPAGNTVNHLFATASTSPPLYQPSQNVLASGMNDTNAGPVRIYSPLFKNLNTGDSIYLLVATIAGQGIIQNAPIQGLVRYAICYN